MKKMHKGILVTVLILALVIASCIKTDATNFKNTCTKGAAQDKYGLNYDYSETQKDIRTLTAQSGTFKITKIEEGAYDEGNPDDNTNFTPGTIHSINGNYQSLIGKTIDANTTQQISIASGVGYGQSYVRITLELAKTDNICQSADDYKKATGTAKNTSATYTGYLIIPVMDYSNKPQIVSNTNYNSSACKAIRDGDNSSGVIETKIWNQYKTTQDAINYYKSIAGYCWQTQVTVNFTDQDKLLEVVKAAIQGYYALNVTTETTKRSDEDQATFDAKFEAAKNNAQNSGHARTLGRNDEAINEVFGMKCAYNRLRDRSVQSSDYQFVNQDYYYATQTTYEDVTYQYNYEGGFTGSETVQDICARTCEEAVEVEYGPPEAAKAGLCIEYQVKVTSRVKCRSTSEGQKPEMPGKCVPAPRCKHKSGWVASQAGPNDEYDKCVKSCDGGKYSQSCSKKCYNKVYGQNGKLSNTTDGMVKFVDLADGNGYNRRSDGYLYWVGSGYATWYTQNDPNLGQANFQPDGNGFKRKYVNGVQACSGECEFYGCPNESYLNDSTITRDYTENVIKYTNTIEKCRAAATCTTRTSTYSISASYTAKGSTEETTIEYPLENSGGTKELISGKENTVNDNTTILSYDGCYKNTEYGDYYQTIWSFPGTWMNNKTGEISYEDKPGNAWHQEKGKFCIPLNAQNVNVKWWNWYMSKQQVESSTGTYKEEYSNKCDNLTNESSYTLTQDDINNIKYNIKAKTYESDKNDNVTNNSKGFGYFGWKFKVECFYALNSGNPTTKSNLSSTDKDKCISNPGDYEVRTVHNENLFPSGNGEESTTITSTGVTVGRTPGYNWTAAAAITKNKNYNVNPDLLISDIQTKGDKIYDTTDLLDYEFYLTKDDIRKIREFNKNQGDYKYDSWPGEMTLKNGMYVYQSPLFRTGRVIYNSKNQLGIIGCNNTNRSDCN